MHYWVKWSPAEDIVVFMANIQAYISYFLVVVVGFLTGAFNNRLCGSSQKEQLPEEPDSNENPSFSE